MTLATRGLHSVYLFRRGRVSQWLPGEFDHYIATCTNNNNNSDTDMFVCLFGILRSTTVSASTEFVTVLLTTHHCYVRHSIYIYTLVVLFYRTS
jgi:hypothetical protein